MEVVAPFPCDEAVWPALLWHPCWLTQEVWRLRTECFLPITRVLVVVGNMSNHIFLKQMSNHIEGWSPDDLKFTAAPSSEGGLDIYIGADIFHVPQHLSVLNPVVQMVLFACCDPSVTVSSEDVCTFRCKKSMVPEGVLDMAKAKETLSSPRTEQGPEDVYTKVEAPGDGEGTGEYIGIPTDAESHQRPHGDGRNVEKNKILKQIKTGSGASVWKPVSQIKTGSGGFVWQLDDEINMQQEQKQQNVGSRVATGVHLWPSVVARTHCFVKEDSLRACKWETLTGAMNSLNLPDNMNCNNNSGCKTISAMAPADSLKHQQFLKDPYQTRQHGNCAPVINSMKQKGERPELHSTIRSSVTVQDSIKNTPAAPATTWIIASASPHHATGNRDLLSDFTPEHSGIFIFGGDEGAMPMQVSGHGILATETMLLPDVWYVPGLVANLVSVSQLVEMDYSVAFGRGKCYIRSTVDDGAIVGAARAGKDGQFAIDFLRVPLGL